MVAKASEKVVKIAVVDMAIAEGTQCREMMDAEVVREYGERMKAGDKFPPVILYEEDRTDKYEGKPVYIMGDGFKRRQAAHQIGKAELDAIVRKGTKWDAMQCNIRENIGQTGERWSLADRRHSVKTVLGTPEGLSQSNNWIAKLCGVSDDLVADLRAQVERETGKSGPSHRTGRDGRKHPAKKPKASREPGDETESNGEADRGKRPGAVKYDWRELHRALGIIIRAPDDIAKGYPGQKDGTEYPAASNQTDKLEVLVKVYKGWERRLLKIDKESE